MSSLISRLDLAPAELAASACAGAFVAGVQGGDGGPTTTGVAAIVKHWVGYGASAEGFDGHNYYGRFSSFPGAAFDAHVDAFGDALTRRVAGVMPTYDVLRGVTVDGELLKFRLGLFDAPFVDSARAAEVVGNATLRAAVDDARRRSIVVLEAERCPLVAPRAAVHLHGVDPAAFERAGFVVVADPARADVAIVRMSAPFERSHPGLFFGARQHEGSLEYADDNPELVAPRRISTAAPATIAVVHLDRPAVLSAVRSLVAALPSSSASTTTPSSPRWRARQRPVVCRSSCLRRWPRCSRAATIVPLTIPRRCTRSASVGAERVSPCCACRPRCRSR